MKVKNSLKIQLGAAVLGVLATTALVAGVTNAQVSSRNNQSENGQKKGRCEHMQKNHDALMTAIENNDYESWLAAEGDNSPFKDKITSENFSKFSEMHNLMKAGDKEGADKIREELGLKNKGMGFGGLIGDKGDRKNGAVEKAIEANDFNAWVAAYPENCPNVDKLTQENFNKLVEAHALEEAGNTDGSNELRKDLGFRQCQFKKGEKMIKK